MFFYLRNIKKYSACKSQLLGSIFLYTHAVLVSCPRAAAPKCRATIPYFNPFRPLMREAGPSIQMPSLRALRKRFSILIILLSIWKFLGNFTSLTVVVVKILGRVRLRFSTVFIFFKCQIEFLSSNHDFVSESHNCCRRNKAAINNQQCGCNWAWKPVKHEFFRVVSFLFRLLLGPINGIVFRSSGIAFRRPK